jgi:glucan 1,3-beta-glucosidase
MTDAENGSGGFMSDIIFVNGYIGMQCKYTQHSKETSNTFAGGNQQFTTRTLNFLSTEIAIWMLWDWGWTCRFSNQVASL